MPKGTPAVQPSQRDTWETPPELFDAWWTEVGGFDLDPCCQANDYTAMQVLRAGGEVMIPPPLREDGGPTISGYAGIKNVFYDGLKMSWKGKVFMNAPHGLALRQWVPKAVHEVEAGNVEFVFALLPARTDVRWWQSYVLRSIRWDVETWDVREPTGLLSEVRFLKGRLTFSGAPAPATFPSAIVVWRR